MPLKLNVGLSRKVGETNYGSRGASVNVELELDSSLVSDPNKLKERIRQVYDVARSSLSEELNGHGPSNGNGHTNGNGQVNDNGQANGNGQTASHNPTPFRPATSSQVKAILAIAAKNRLDIPLLLQNRFHAQKPEELSVRQASEFIDMLKSTSGSLTMPTLVFDHISYSSISLFQSCPLRFYFKYVLGLPEGMVSSSLVFGSALHLAVQLHFEELLAGNAPPSLQDLLDVYEESWQLRDMHNIRFGKGEDYNTLHLLAVRMLKTFQASTFARPEGIILGIEEEFRSEIVPGCPDLLARVDLIVDVGDALLVSDFKTARSAWTAEQVTENSTQLLLYSEPVRALADGKPLRLEFAVLTKTKMPELLRSQVIYSSQDIERTRKVVANVWKAIDSNNFYPNPSPLNCASCPFQKPCRDWHG